MKNIGLLKQTPLLSECKQLKDILQSNGITINKYIRNATIYNQGDKCDTLDIVLSGKLVSYSLAENGSSTVMFEFVENNLIGANLILAERNIYPLNIYCTEECSIAHIKKETVFQLLHDYNFVIHFIKSISQNSMGMNNKIAMFSRKTIRDNIIDYLKQQSQIQSSNEITLPISKKELADYLGVQRQSLFRELKKMKGDGIINIKDRIITINKTE